MIYFVQAGEGGPIKIGLTVNRLGMRLANLRVGCPQELKFLGYVPGGRATERELQERFEAYRVRGEWFRPCHDLLDFIEKEAVKEIPTSPDKSPSSYQFNLLIEDGEMERLRSLSSTTGWPIAKLMRWGWDQCFKEEVLNELFPQSSGRFFEWRGK